jgi:hypothetical protein
VSLVAAAAEQGSSHAVKAGMLGVLRVELSHSRVLCGTAVQLHQALHLEQHGTVPLGSPAHARMLQCMAMCF